MFFKDRSIFIEDEKYFIEDKVAEFIPIACHYDKETLLTKNGELLQIIKISGLETNDSEFQKVNLRDQLRKVIKKHVTEYKYAVHIHVLRNRENMVPPGEMPFGFAEELNQQWAKKNNWDKQLVNTLYVTIIRQNIQTGTFDPKTLIFPLIKNQHYNHLNAACEELHNITNNMVDDLKRFGSTKLAMQKTEDEGYISELLSLYNNLVQLTQTRAHVPIKDLSEYLANIKIKYKFNTVVIEGADFKRYCAVFSLKQPQNISVSAYDKLLQLGMQFIISESLYFVSSDTALKNHKKMMSHLEAAKAQDIAQENDLADILNEDKGNNNDYCAHQVTLLVYSDDESFFQDKLNKTVEVLQNIGLVAVREDFKMAKCFWSQLPGNFRFIDRINYTATNLIGALTSIHHKNIGCYSGSKWGPAISLFRNNDGNPYYFNFHNHNNGNTLIIGNEHSGKNVLMKFFLTQSTKLNPRIIFIDGEGNSEKFIEELGGLYVKPNPDDFSPVKIKLFDKELFRGKLELFSNFLTNLIYPRASDNAQYQAFFAALAKSLFEGNENEDPYTLLSGIIEKSEDEAIKSSFNSYFNSEIYSNFFDEDFLDLFTLEDILSIDITELSKSKPIQEAFLVLLLLKIPSLLDGRPTIIAFNKCYDLFFSNVFSSLFPSWLDELTSKNAIAFFSTDTTDKILDNDCLRNCLDKFATQIFTSNKFADKKFKHSFSLNEFELTQIKAYSVERRMFVLKQGEYSIVGVLNLADLPEILEVLK
ncbi:type IV secretion system protein VirB4 [endosymbiont of Acanthamoeba sp. UWC8]|uniref:VirB4 family type IV secretion/conjugal transfer ATPase n=1 Tax=endosymbiont of Acanthamoeba sp. UWC8 TaxID=86106 RepID=UPI0004D16C1A|nr:hypothetical protein [endosymbiont of Acanthamoeba sp. UWC8]AIF81024.1 type IV secretion system protein VirB4 [endosymbiont of Acanthamoeba sp. UWC8]